MYRIFSVIGRNRGNSQKRYKFNSKHVIVANHISNISNKLLTNILQRYINTRIQRKIFKIVNYFVIF